MAYAGLCLQGGQVAQKSRDSRDEVAKQAFEVARAGGLRVFGNQIRKQFCRTVGLLTLVRCPVSSPDSGLYRLGVSG